MAITNTNAGLASLFEDPYYKAVRDALYSQSEVKVNQAAEDAARSTNEATFGRGVGVGTPNLDVQDRITLTRLRALSEAAQNSILGASAEARAAQGGNIAERQVANQASQFKQQLDTINRNNTLQLLAMGGVGLGSLLGPSLFGTAQNPGVITEAIKEWWKNKNLFGGALMTSPNMDNLSDLTLNDFQGLDQGLLFNDPNFQDLTMNFLDPRDFGLDQLLV